jgi:hypothetical protein
MPIYPSTINLTWVQMVNGALKDDFSMVLDALKYCYQGQTEGNGDIQRNTMACCYFVNESIDFRIRFYTPGGFSSVKHFVNYCLNHANEINIDPSEFRVWVDLACRIYGLEPNLVQLEPCDKRIPDENLKKADPKDRARDPIEDLKMVISSI